MPAEIIATSHGQEADFQIALPGYNVPIEMYDRREDIDIMLMVRCGNKDYASDIFLFPQPQDLDSDDTTELLPYCNEETFITQLGHGSECRVTAHSRSGIPIELVINHLFVMSSS